MKEKLTRNISLKILSILLAAILWLAITNIEDPIKQRSFTKKVDIINADEIKALDKVYSIIEGDTVSFSVAAKRTVADALTADNFSVTADLSKLSDLNTVTIHINYTGNKNDVSITNGLNQVMKVSLEDLVEKYYQVYVEQTGQLTEGHYIYEKTASTILKVTGPKSKIEKIGEIVVTVDVTGYTRSFNTSEEPKVLDADGNVIDSSNLTFNKKSIPVFVGMYNTKNINLKILPTGTPATGYTMSSIVYEPQTIEIAAEDNVLKNINELKVEENVEGVSDNVEKQLNLADILQEQFQDDVKLVGDKQTAVVNITIDKAETKELSILPSSLEVRNKTSNLSLKFMNSMPITIRLSGPAEEIKDVKVGDLDPYIDLSGYSSGTYSVKVQTNLSGFLSMTNIPTVGIYLENQSLSGE